MVLDVLGGAEEREGLSAELESLAFANEQEDPRALGPAGLR